MENSLAKNTETIFESIKHTDEEGLEFWYARELMTVLEYKQWRRFEQVIEKVKESCKNSDISILDHFADVGKIVKAGATSKDIGDVKLTRYACYLIAQNGDSRKQNVKNKYLFDTAKLVGVKNYGKFNNYGYRGLYNGETAKDIANRKGISEKEDILDYMSSTELAANLFRITQTDEVLKNKNVDNEDMHV